MIFVYLSIFILLIFTMLMSYLRENVLILNFDPNIYFAFLETLCLFQTYVWFNIIFLII